MLYLPLITVFVTTCVLRYFVVKRLMLNHTATWRAIGQPRPVQIFGSDGWKTTKFIWSDNVGLSRLYVVARLADVLYYVVFVGTLFMGFDRAAK